MDKRIIGLLAENKAARYLKKIKYEIIDRNFKTNIGEIDIIAKKDDYIVFVEVKYRKNLEYGAPSSAVDYKKQNKYRIISQQYILSNDFSNLGIRFDVIEITGNELNHIINAF